MLEKGEDRIDAPYLVPTHLGEHQSVGPIPLRTFYAVLLTGLLVSAPIATIARARLGDVGLWFAVLPLLLAAPFALPWLDPPAEHGLIRLASHLVIRIRRRTVLGIPQQRDLAALCLGPNAIEVPHGHGSELRAIYRVSTVNLETASAHTRRSVRRQWGSVLNALPHPIQVVVRSTPVATLPVIERIRDYGSTASRELSAWLGAHLTEAILSIDNGTWSCLHPTLTRSTTAVLLWKRRCVASASNWSAS